MYRYCSTKLSRRSALVLCQDHRLSSKKYTCNRSPAPPPAVAKQIARHEKCISVRSCAKKTLMSTSLKGPRPVVAVVAAKSHITKNASRCAAAQLY